MRIKLLSSIFMMIDVIILHCVVDENCCVRMTHALCRLIDTEILNVTCDVDMYEGLDSR